MQKIIIIVAVVLIILDIGNGYFSVKEAEKACKFQNTYMVSGTTRLCEDKQ